MNKILIFGCWIGYTMGNIAVASYRHNWHDTFLQIWGATMLFIVICVAAFIIKHTK